jgi:plastocyanin
MPLLRRLATGAFALSTVLAIGACSQNDNGNNTLVGKNNTPTPPGAPASTGAPSPSGGGGTLTTLEAKDNEFVPKTATAKAGTISFEMKNTGASPHTFTSADLKVDVNVDAGKTGKIEIADAKPGTYKFICKYHEALGMTGELTVT